MGFGITSAMAGAKARELELEVLANNISNIQTTGYKEMSVSFTSELNNVQPENKDLANAQAILKTGKTYVSHKQGAVYETGNPTDMAIQGDGFFTIQTPEGMRYTRDGSFSLSQNGTMINAHGDAVLSDSGPITIPTGSVVHIGTDGQVTADGAEVGKVRVVDFIEKEQLVPTGNNYFSGEGLTTKDSARSSIVQGHLENSNVNLVHNMTMIIQVSRAYESLQKSIKQQISASKLLNNLAKMG